MGTVRGAARRLENLSNCAFECDYYYSYYDKLIGLGAPWPTAPTTSLRQSIHGQIILAVMETVGLTSYRARHQPHRWPTCCGRVAAILASWPRDAVVCSGPRIAVEEDGLSALLPCRLRANTAVEQRQILTRVTESEKKHHTAQKCRFEEKFCSHFI